MHSVQHIKQINEEPSENITQIHIKNRLNQHLVHRPQPKELIQSNILHTFSKDESLQKVMNNVFKQRLQKLLNEKLSNRKSIQSLIRDGILKSEDTSSTNDNLNTDRRDMYRRMSDHSLTEFLCQRPKLNELVDANMVHDVMTWTKIKYNNGIIPNKRNCHQMILHSNQNELYVIGGYNTGSINIDVLKFDIDKNKWFRPLIGGQIPIERYSHSVVNIDDNIYTFGGFNVDHKWLNDLYTLHIDYTINSTQNNVNNSMLLWDKPKTTGHAPTSRAAHAAAVIGKKMYIFGGNNGNKVFNDLYCLDTITMKWCKIRSCGHKPSARSAHTMTVINNKYLIVFGGINENGKPLNDIYIFNTETNKWIKPKINGTSPEARGGHSAVCIKNKLFIFGGGYNGKILNDLHIFNITNNQWLRPADTGIIPTPRTGASIISNKNNIIYIFGGGNVQNDTLFNDLYVLDTGYFTTDNKQLNTLIYANKSTNQNENIISSMDNEMNLESILSNDICDITKDINNVICCVEYNIQQKIEQFKQKEEAYIMILRSIEAERQKLTNDIRKDVELLKFSVKESMDKLQQKFIGKMLRKHVDYVNNKAVISDDIISENQCKYEFENKENEMKSEALKTSNNSHVISETNSAVNTNKNNLINPPNQFKTEALMANGNMKINSGNMNENKVNHGGLDEQMSANQHQMMIQYQKQLEKFNSLQLGNGQKKKKRRKKKRRGRRRRKKNNSNELNGIGPNNLINEQNFIMNNGNGNELLNHGIYYNNLYQQYFPPPMQFRLDYNNRMLNTNVMNYSNNLYQLNIC